MGFMYTHYKSLGKKIAAPRDGLIGGGLAGCRLSFFLSLETEGREGGAERQQGGEGRHENFHAHDVLLLNAAVFPFGPAAIIEAAGAASYP